MNNSGRGDDKAFAVTTTVAEARFVTLSAAFKVAQAGDGVRVFGVALEPYTSTDKPGGILVRTRGQVEVTAGAAIAAGQIVASDANGKAVPAADGDYPAGVALSAAADADYRIWVELNPSLVPVPTP